MSTLLEEKEAIRELLAMYCFASDRLGLDAFLDLFTEDCIWDGGPWGRFHGRKALGEFYSKAVPSGEPSFRHFTANEIITVHGDTASVRSYVHVLNAKDQPPKSFFAGFYEDELVKVDGRWLFKSRVMHPT